VLGTKPDTKANTEDAIRWHALVSRWLICCARLAARCRARLCETTAPPPAGASAIDPGCDHCVP